MIKIIEVVQKEWPMIKQAPLTFFSTLFILFCISLGLSWLGVDWRYSGIIQNKDSVIESKNERIEKLEGLIASEKATSSQVPLKKQNVGDLNKVFQNNEAVGNVTGEVKALQDGHLLFSEISETGMLDKGNFIEYQGNKYRIVSIGKQIVLYLDSQSGIKNNVLKDVTCKIWN